MERIKSRDEQKFILVGVLACFSVVAVLCVLLTVSISDRIALKAQDTLTEQNAQEINAHMVANTNTALQYLRDQASALEISFALSGNTSEADLTRYLAAMDEETGLYNAMMDTDGYLYDAEGRSLATSAISFTGEFLSGKQDLITDNETIHSRDYIVYALYLEQPLSLQDRTICGVLIGIDSSSLAGRVNLSSAYSGSYASIIQDNGYFILKNAEEVADGRNEYSILKTTCGITDEVILEIREELAAGGNCLLSVTFPDRGDYYLYFSRLDEADWIIVNHIPASYIHSSLQGMKTSLNRLTLITGILVFVSAIVMMLALLRNNKRLRQTRSDLSLALEKAEQANLAKTKFLNNMSHDIRTPMNAIMGLVTIASRRNSDPAVQDSLDKITSSSTYLLSLINDVLDISRIESGKTELKKTNFPLRELVDETQAIIRDSIKERPLTFKVSRSDARYIVNADKTRIEEVLINILSNAVKYTRDGGTIWYSEEVMADDDGKHLTIHYTVSDTGIGMSEEFQKKLFEEFTQESQDARTQYKGTGLGMAITKKLVDMMGGEIRVSSVKGEGSTFRIVLPLELVEKQEKAPVENETAAPISLEGKRALLVEDNDINAEIAFFMLEDVGMTARRAENGQIAVETFRSAPPGTFDIILMDVMMPVMDGYEATRQIRAMTHPDASVIPILAMTANAYSEDKDKAISAGMNDYLTKPIDQTALEKSLAFYLRKK